MTANFKFKEGNATNYSVSHWYLNSLTHFKDIAEVVATLENKAAGSATLSNVIIEICDLVSAEYLLLIKQPDFNLSQFKAVWIQRIIAAKKNLNLTTEVSTRAIYILRWITILELSLNPAQLLSYAINPTTSINPFAGVSHSRSLRSNFFFSRLKETI